MSYISRILAALSVTLISSSAMAAVTPLGIAIFAPVQFPNSDFTIAGARASAIMGRHQNVYGIDVSGIGNITQQNFAGMAVSGLFNRTQGTTTVIGFQIAGAANINIQKTKVFGLQLAAVNSNVAEATVVGAQVGLANLAHFTKVWILQAGAYNTARDVYGFQIGIVNVAEALHGIQIGLLNFNRTGLLAVSPIINIGF